MAYKALILDLDGTLVESLPGIAGSANAALEEHGYPPHDLASIRSFIGDGTWMLIRKAIKDAPDSIIDEVTESFKQHYSDGWKDGTEIFEGFLPLLQRCGAEGIKMSVLSNKPHTFTTEIVDTLFSEIHFDVVMGQQEGIPKKPAPDGTLICIEKLGVSAAETLFVGDSLVDLQTAKAANVPCAAVSWGYDNVPELKAEGADYFANSMEELAEIIFS